MKTFDIAITLDKLQVLVLLKNGNIPAAWLRYIGITEWKVICPHSLNNNRKYTI